MKKFRYYLKKYDSSYKLIGIKSLWKYHALIIYVNTRRLQNAAKLSPWPTFRQDTINFTSQFLLAISLSFTENVRQSAPFYGKENAFVDKDRTPSPRDSFFFLFSLLNGNGELRLRFMGGVTLRRVRNFDFMAARLIVRHWQWTAKCIGALPPPSSCHRITIPQRKRRKSPGTWSFSNGLWQRGVIVATEPTIRDYPNSAERIIDNQF